MGWLNPKGAEKVLTLYKILAELFTLNTVRVLGGGGVGEEPLLQKGPSPTKHSNTTMPHKKKAGT